MYLRIKSTQSTTNLSEQEKIIKAELESWIADIYKHAELEEKLQKAFENSKSHVQSLSEL
ncbi:MAG: hypothetical protein MAG458_01573 [Nitrosopumilus sp.]|nr:hypothetical protein [Nitrosopumilus sp.]